MLGNRKWIFLTLILVTIAGCSQPDQKTAFRRPDAWRPTPQPSPENVLEDKPPTILPGTYIAAARMFESRGMIDKAAAQYRKAIAVNQSYAPAYHRLGLLLSMSGHRAEAIEMLRRAAQLDPNNAVIRNNLGFELVLAERWEEAEPELTAAIALVPSFPRANVNLGIVRSKLGRFDEAMACFRRVLPETDAQYNIGLMYRGQGRYQEAANAFRRVLDIDPRFAAASTQLAQLASRYNILPEERPITSFPTNEPTFAQRTTESRLNNERTNADRVTRYGDDASWDGPFEQDRDKVARSITNRTPKARTVGTRQPFERPDDRWDELDAILEIADNEIRCLQERENGPQSAAPQQQDEYLAQIGEPRISDSAIESTPSTAKRAGLTKSEVLAILKKSGQPERRTIDNGEIIECFADIEGPTSPADPDDVIDESIFTAYDMVYGETLLVGADNPLDAWELIEILEDELQVVRNEITCLEDPYETRNATYASSRDTGTIRIERRGPAPAYAAPGDELVGPPAELASWRSPVNDIIRPAPAPPEPTARLISHKKQKTSQDKRIDPIPPAPASPARRGQPIDPNRGSSTWHPDRPANISDQVDTLLATVMGEISGWYSTDTDAIFPRSATGGEPMHRLFAMFEANDECQDSVLSDETRTTRADSSVRVSDLHGRSLAPMP